MHFFISLQTCSYLSKNFWEVLLIKVSEIFVNHLLFIICSKTEKTKKTERNVTIKKIILYTHGFDYTCWLFTFISAYVLFIYVCLYNTFVIFLTSYLYIPPKLQYISKLINGTTCKFIIAIIYAYALLNLLMESVRVYLKKTWDVFMFKVSLAIVKILLLIILRTRENS